MKGKKAYWNGVLYGILALIAVLLIVVIIGMYQLGQEEIINPVNEQLVTSLNESNKTNKEQYINLINDAKDDVLNITLPYNLFLMFIVSLIFIIGIVSAVRTPRGSMIEYLFFSVGGLLVLLFIASIGIIKLINFLRDDILFYLFGDALTTYLPFGVFILDNWIEVLLFFGLVMVLVNRFAGSEFDRLRF